MVYFQFSILPLICIRNLIYIYFCLSNQNSNINVEDLSRVTGKPINQILNVILNCISKGFIKGYVCLKKNILILSKIEPFPTILKDE